MKKVISLLLALVMALSLLPTAVWAEGEAAAAPAEEDAAAPAPFDGGMYAPKAEEIPAPFEAPRRHRRSDRRQGK